MIIIIYINHHNINNNNNNNSNNLMVIFYFFFFYFTKFLYFYSFVLIKKILINLFKIILYIYIYIYTKKVKVESRDLRYNMFSFKIKLPDNGISGVRTLFFSTTETDPTMMHQLIYSDILQAIENPSSKAVPCRVYDKHGRGKGVYILQEDTTSKDFMVRHFLKTDGLTHDEISAKTGSILLGSPRADFYWSKNSKASKEYKEFKIIRNFLRKNETLHDLKHLSKALHDLNVGSKEEIEAFSNEWFDIPIFLKSLAVNNLFIYLYIYLYIYLSIYLTITN